MYEEHTIVLLLIAGILASGGALIHAASEDAKQEARCEVAGGTMMNINDTPRCVKSVQYIEVKR